MSPHPDDLLLHDYVDDELEGAELAQLEGHLRGCETCRREVEGIRALVRQAGALRSAPEAVPDRWDAIRAELAAPEPANRPGRSWVPWVAAAAAAAVLIGGLALWSVEPAPPAAVAVAPEPPSLDQGLADASAAAAQLEAALAARDDLDPQAVQEIRHNLRLLDEAIAQTRAALEGHPHDDHLERTLARLQRQKLATLQRAQLGGAG